MFPTMTQGVAVQLEVKEIIMDHFDRRRGGFLCDFGS